MSSDAERARRLQFEVREAEAEQLSKGIDDYGDAEVRQAVVHARQDLVLLASYLSVLNARARRITWLLTLILVTLVFLVFR